jgi:predicted transcriptional regulator
MKLSEVKETLKATVIVGENDLDKEVVAAGSADLMDDILAALAEGSVLLTGVTNEQVLRTAKVAGVGAIVFVRGKDPGERIIEMAKSFNVPLLQTHYSMFVASGRLYMNGMRGLDGSW